MRPDILVTAKIGLLSALTSAVALMDIIVMRTGDVRDRAIVDRLVALKRDVLVGDGADTDAADETAV